MTDPNTLYKQSFHTLTARLGRVPDTRDKEYWEIGDQLRKAWGGQVAPAAKGLPESSALAATGTSTREGSEATGEARTIQTGSGEQTTGEAGNGSVRDYQTATGALSPGTVGGRGPNGGVMAVCGKCGRVWERPRQRGRPALLCGECR